MTNYFPITGIVWILLFLYKYFNEDPAIGNNQQDDSESKRYINYMSNGRIIDGPHMYYYINMINLYDADVINGNIIELAANERHSLINKIDYDYNWPIASRDVKAAKSYLIDRWNYMTSFN